ncbi:MAG: hydrogenase-4 component E [Rhodospirillales bacterium RIFCSPLOWO2_12_FULL_58_28]|nr:MAG: hydrogenase-4 component E [Rhodospirillales bacterium RIFCSPLOWO2_02_FULL_58_16]OHC77658.1 MAG: hydrogenase-4 component E [Rhodospirillales bacterium RIFCSPLOWO2_12_FULL_58_28]
MANISSDISHSLAGAILVISFMLLYQERMFGLLKVFAMQAMVLSIAVAWQAYTQQAAHLYVTAAIAFGVKGVVIPWSLHRIVPKLGIYRNIEKVVGVGMTMLAGVGLTVLAIMVIFPVTTEETGVVREDLAFAFAVILLGFLMMITRRNAVSQIIGFMSLENGLILAATGAKGMPLVVEISVAFSVLIAFFVFGVFIFRIRERFDTIDVDNLNQFRGDRG